MGYEPFERKNIKGGPPNITISNKGRFVFNKQSAEIFQKENVKLIQILWDVEARKIAIKPVNEDVIGSCRINYYEKGNGGTFSSGLFLDKIGYNHSETRSFSLKKSKDIFEIEEIPIHCFKAKKPKKLSKTQKSK